MTFVETNALFLFVLIISEDHGMLKSELNGIEEKLNVILNDRIPPENKPAPV